MSDRSLEILAIVCSLYIFAKSIYDAVITFETKAKVKRALNKPWLNKKDDED